MESSSSGCDFDWWFILFLFSKHCLENLDRCWVWYGCLFYFIALLRRWYFFSTKSLIFFLFLHKNICCGYSLEAPHRHVFVEHCLENLDMLSLVWCLFYFIALRWDGIFFQPKNVALISLQKTYVVDTHTSNEFPQHMFSWRNKKNISSWRTLILLYLWRTLILLYLWSLCFLGRALKFLVHLIWSGYTRLA